jgi:hypothetical protein
VSDLPLLTATRLKTARTCMRMEDIQYRQGYKPASVSEALRFGTLMHDGLEAWWLRLRELQSGTYCDADQSCLDAALAAVTRAADPYERASAEALLTGYHLRWQDAGYTVVAVEQEFRAPLVDPRTHRPSRTWQLGGKIDVIVADRDGRVLVMEHKTSSEDVSPGSTYWTRLRMDGQISVYWVGARALGYDVAGVIYDVIKKPGLRPLKVNQRRTVDETPDEYRARVAEDIAEKLDGYFARGDVVRLEREIDEALVDVVLTGQAIRASELAGVSGRNPGACQQYGRPCSYLDVCAGMASLEDETRFRKTTAHPELSGVAGA